VTNLVQEDTDPKTKLTKLENLGSATAKGFEPTP
jgi:hypothetical protein